MRTQKKGNSITSLVVQFHSLELGIIALKSIPTGVFAFMLYIWNSGHGYHANQ